MIKKLFFYLLIFFTLFLFGTGSFYTYNVYYLKKPIIVKGFDDKIQKLIKQFVKEKSSFSGYNIQVNKSIIQIDKFPYLLKIRLIDIKIEDKKSILTSNLEDLSINLSIQDIFNIIFTNKNLSINKLEIDNIKLSASMEKNGIVPGPVLSFFIKQMNSKHRGNLINFNKNQFKINDVSLIIKDKTNFFKERNVIFKCKDLTFLKFTETINNLNLKCNKSELARFEINIKNTEENKIILEGSIKNLKSKFFNLKKIKMHNVLGGLFVADFRFDFSTNFLLEKFKLNIKEKSYLILYKHNEKNSVFKSKKLNIKGNVSWNSKDKYLNLNDFKFNENYLNGKIILKNQKFLTTLKLNFPEVDLLRLKNYYSKNENIKFIKDIRLERWLNNFNRGKLKDFTIHIAFQYDRKLDDFLFNQAKGKGKLLEVNVVNYNKFFKKSEGILQGNFNFFLDKDDFLFDLDGSIKGAKFLIKKRDQDIFFDEIKFSTSVENSMVSLNQVDFMNNGKKEIFTKGRLWIDNNKLYIGELNIKINEIGYKEFFSLAHPFYNVEKLSNMNFEKGKLVNSNIFIKNRDEKGNHLDDSIFFGEVKLKNTNLKIDNLNTKLKINYLTVNFDKQTNLFGKIDGYFNLYPFKLDYQFDNNNNIKSFGKIVPNKILKDFIVEKTGFKIKSFPKVNFEVTGKVLDGYFSVETYVDNFFSEIENTLLNINAKNNEPSNFKAVFKYKNFKLNSIENINLNYGKKSISAIIKILENNNFQVRDLKSKDFDIKKLNFKTDNKKIYVSAQGDFLDLSYLKNNLRKQIFLKNKKIYFDILSPKIKIDRKLFVSGNYRGELELNKIVSIADGKMFLGDKSILDEGEIKINGENNNFFLIGHGHLGGANTKITIKSLENKLPQLYFDTQDGGKLLNALNFTDKIKSGAMVLEIDFLDEELSKYSGKIKAKKFSVIKAPGIVKSLSSLGFSGINSLFVGQGVKFESGVASFLNKNDEMIFKKILINNDTVSIFLNGTYYEINNNVDFTGSIAPMKLVSKLVSVVPAIGELLTGLDKKGLFMGQFKLSGDVENPEIDINEMSFAPGILRDMFSKDWIKEKNIQLNK